MTATSTTATAAGRRCLTETTLACGPAPLTGCRRPVRSDKASLLIKRGSTLFKDQLKWLWLAGEITSVAEYGDPLGATQYHDVPLRQHRPPTGSHRPRRRPVRRQAVLESPHLLGVPVRRQGSDARRRQKVNLKAGVDGKAQIKLCARRQPRIARPFNRGATGNGSDQEQQRHLLGGDLQCAAAVPVEHDLQGQSRLRSSATAGSCRRRR